MPRAIVYTISPIQATNVPSSLGRAAHAAFLRLIRDADPDLAARIHDDDGVKPLTVSNVIGLGTGKFTRVEPDRRYGLRVTLLTDDLSRNARGALDGRGACRTRSRRSGMARSGAGRTQRGRSLGRGGELYRASGTAAGATRQRSGALDLQLRLAGHLSAARRQHAAPATGTRLRQPPREMERLCPARAARRGAALRRRMRNGQSLQPTHRCRRHQRGRAPDRRHRAMHLT